MATSRRYSWFLVISAVALFGLGLVNLLVNTAIWNAWLPLLVLMPLPFVLGVRRLRAHPAKDH